MPNQRTKGETTIFLAAVVRRRGNDEEPKKKIPATFTLQEHCIKTLFSKIFSKMP